MESPSRDELEAALVWEPGDVIPRRPAMTAFRQRARLEQARWRERQGLPVGSQPHSPRPGHDARPVGSRILLAFARETGANLMTPAALDAARRRLSRVEREQNIDRQRLWADLLSSEALAFNLFGDLAADVDRATRLARTWFGDVPGTVKEVRFLYSPGRLEAQWLNSLRQFAAAFILDRPDGTHGIVGVEVSYHERLTIEQPKPENLWRNREVHERSGAFRPGAFDQVKGRSDRWEPWLQHLLLLSMLQHPGGDWTWGRYVRVHPAGNVDMADLAARYRDLLDDDTTYLSTTMEDVLASGAIPAATVRALRDRYLVPDA